jgi:Phage integrase family
MLQERLGLSQRRACAIVGQHRSTQRHTPTEADPDRDLRERLRRFAKRHPRWGYRRAHAVLGTRGLGGEPQERSSVCGVTVTLPAPIVDELRSHVAEFTERGRNGRVFVRPKVGTLRRPNFQEAWVAATKAADVPTLRFHDLRHVGNTLASNTGASLRELMARMGHASPQAALIYQHATAERDRAIADALGQMIVASLADEDADEDDDQGDEGE